MNGNWPVIINQLREISKIISVYSFLRYNVYSDSIQNTYLLSKFICKSFLQLSIHLHQTTTHIILITTTFKKIICKEAQNEISFGTKHNKLKICHQIWMWYYLQDTNYINIKFTDESLDKSYVVSNNVTRYKIRILVYLIWHKYKQ